MRIRGFAAASAIAAIMAPAAADAHVSLHPNTVPAGAFATLDVRVPGEQEGAYVKRVDVQFPPGFIGVDYANVPGWTVKVTESKLKDPVEEDGEKVETEVSEISWTWTGPLGKVSDGQFVEFPLSVAIPGDAAGKALQFKTVQSYSDGQVVHWIENPLDAEHPSPRINVTPKGGVIEDVAGEEAGPAAGQSAAASPAPVASTVTATAGKGVSKGLAIAALIVGALGLAAGLLALGTAGRRRSS